MPNTDKLKSVLSENIRRYMKQKGINTADLSRALGYSFTTVSDWVNGRKYPRMDKVQAIADYFGIMKSDLTEEYHESTIEESNNYSILVSAEEHEHIKKYRVITPDWKEAVDDVLDIGYRQYESDRQARAAAVRAERERSRLEAAEESVVAVTVFSIPCQIHPMSAGTGEFAEAEYAENLRLTKEPPYGASYVARVSGNSMEPTYYDGDLVFVHATVEIRPGQVGVFLMDGEQYIKELGDGELISHNESYDPRPMTPDIRCQGLVLGVCDESYFER